MKLSRGHIAFTFDNVFAKFYGLHIMVHKRPYRSENLGGLVGMNLNIEIPSQITWLQTRVQFLKSHGDDQNNGIGR